MTDDPRVKLPPQIAAMTVPELARAGRAQARKARRLSGQVRRTPATRRHRRERLSEAYLQAYCDAALCRQLIDRVKVEEKHRRAHGGLERRLMAGDVCGQEEFDKMLRAIGEKFDQVVADA